MAINKDHLLNFVIRPCLIYLEAWSEGAENLLLGTAAQESHLGTYLVQINGPARGIYQCEPATHRDLWENFLNYHGRLSDKIINLTAASQQGPVDQLVWNLWYATAICRAHYLRYKDPIPDAQDILGMAQLWKRRYNTELGAGTVDEFLENYDRFIA